MTTDRHLALMALMNEVVAPSKTYEHCVRRASAAASTSPEYEAAVATGNAALDDIEEAVRRWVAAHPDQPGLADGFRSLFGNVIVKGRDGAWANVADYIATGARIPVCGSFYPAATDTRCVLPKGHRGSHRAPWGDRVMAWPYDPRETQPDPVCGDANDGDWCELEPGHEGHHRADTAEWAQRPAPAAVVGGVSGTGQ